MADRLSVRWSVIRDVEVVCPHLQYGLQLPNGELLALRESSFHDERGKKCAAGAAELVSYCLPEIMDYMIV